MTGTQTNWAIKHASSGRAIETQKNTQPRYSAGAIQSGRKNIYGWRDNTPMPTEEMIAVELLRIALHGERESDRVAACRAFRAWGIMQSVGDDAAKKTTIEVRFVRPDPKPCRRSIITCRPCSRPITLRRPCSRSNVC